MAGATITGSAELERKIRRIRNGLTSASRRAVNRAAVSTRAEMARRVKREWKRFRISTIKKYIAIEKARVGRPTARVAHRWKKIPVRKLRPKQTKRGISYAAPGGRQQIVGAFFAPIRGRDFVMKRAGPERLPINEQFHVAESPLRNERIALQRHASETMRKNLDHEIERLAQREGDG